MPYDSVHIYRTGQYGLDFKGDIAAFFGVDIGSEEDLCKLAAIKDWAKCKPIRSSLDEITLTERQDKYFGFDVTICGPNGNLSTFLAAYESQWQYLRPRGISYNEWYRALDFDGYYDNVNSFVYPNGSTFPKSYVVGAGGSGVYFELAINTGNNLKTGSIGIDNNGFRFGGHEGTAFGSCYFGLLFVQGSSFQKLITASTPINQNGSTTGITIAESGGALAGLTTGQTYTVYPVISLNARTTLTNFSNQDQIIALPLIGAFAFQVKSPQSVENIAYRDASAYMGIRARLYYNFTIGHQPNTQTITVQWYVYTAPNGVGDTSGTLVDSGSNFFTDTVTITGQKNIANPLWLRLRCEKQNVPSVYDETYIQVGDDPDLDPDA